MKRVKSPSAGLKDPAVLPVADSLVTGATGKTELAHSPVTLVDIGDQRDAASDALTSENEARDAWLAARQVRRGAFSVLRTSLNRFALHATSVYAGDKTKLAVLGLSVVELAPTYGTLPAPTNLRSRPGKLNQSVDLLWKASPGRQSHELQCAESADGPWTEIYRGKKTRATCTDRVSGKEYFFRVRAHGASGPGTWSDITKTRAS